MKLVIKRSMTRKWYVILLSRNGKTLMQSEMYNTKQAALKMIHSITNFTGEHGLVYEDHSKNTMTMTVLALLASLALLQSPAMAREAVVTTEWHPASWVQGGYEDRDTIVTSKPAPKPVFVRGGEAPRPAVELPKPHKSVLIPAINYPERITEPEPKEPKKLSGPSLGWNGPRREYTAYAGSSITTWRYLPNQKTRR